MEKSEAPSSLSARLPIEDVPSIGYLCPLYTELVAVIATFDEYLGRQEVGEDEYYYGRVGGRRAVGVHFDHGEVGPIAAVEYASTLVLAHPSLKNSGSICLLVGTAGGLWTEERDVRLGDVVIGTRIWDWRAGKLTPHGLETTGYPKDVSKRLRRRLPGFLYDRDGLEKLIAQKVKTMRDRDPKNDLKWTYPGHANDRLYLDDYINAYGKSPTVGDGSNAVARAIRTVEHPKVHDGLIASGNIILKDPVNRRSLLEKRVYAVEMEACGVPNDFIVVRGISNYADSHKNDIWQPYAASIAAACARLLVDHLVSSAEQNAMYLQRLKSSPSDMPGLETSRTLSNTPLAITGRDGVSMQEPLSLRLTQSNLIIPTIANDGKVEANTWRYTNSLSLPLEPLDGNISNRNLLVEQLLVATVTPLPSAVTTYSASELNAELVEGTVESGGSDRELLFQIDDPAIGAGCEEMLRQNSSAG